MRKVIPKEIYVRELVLRCEDCRFMEEEEGVLFRCFLNYASPEEVVEALENHTVCKGCRLWLISGE